MHGLEEILLQVTYNVYPDNQLTSLVSKTFSLSLIFVCNLVFGFCNGGQYSITAHIASLITVTVIPLSTSMAILFPFMRIVIWYGFILPVISPPLKTLCTFLVAFQTPYPLKPSDVYAC